MGCGPKMWSQEESGRDGEALHLFCWLFWGSCPLLQGNLGDVPSLALVLLGLESRDGAQGRTRHTIHMSTRVCACVCFHAVISAFAAASVAEPSIHAFPSLISPNSCLSLNPLVSVCLGSLFLPCLSSLISLVYTGICLPQEKVC